MDTGIFWKSCQSVWTEGWSKGRLPIVLPQQEMPHLYSLLLASSPTSSFPTVLLPPHTVRTAGGGGRHRGIQDSFFLPQISTA